MRRKRRTIAVVTITVTILITTICVWPIIQLNSFYNAEARAISKFDTLNNEIFATIPIPTGVVELEQFSNGITSPTTTHGRYLTTDYQMTQTQPDLVVDHYDKFFLSNGWKAAVAHEDFYTYSRGTTCVDVSFYGDKYSLIISHDFWGQSFSPSDPNTWLLRFLEFGETAFATCPP